MKKIEKIKTSELYKKALKTMVIFNRLKKECNKSGGYLAIIEKHPWDHRLAQETTKRAKVSKGLDLMRKLDFKEAPEFKDKLEKVTWMKANKMSQRILKTIKRRHSESFNKMIAAIQKYGIKRVTIGCYSDLKPVSYLVDF